MSGRLAQAPNIGGVQRGSPLARGSGGCAPGILPQASPRQEALHPYSLADGIHLRTSQKFILRGLKPRGRFFASPDGSSQNDIQNKIYYNITICIIRWAEEPKGFNVLFF